MTPRELAEMRADVLRTMLDRHTWESAGIDLCAIQPVLMERVNNLLQYLVLREDHLYGGELGWCETREGYFPRARPDERCMCGWCVGCARRHDCEECEREAREEAGVR